VGAGGRVTVVIQRAHQASQTVSMELLVS